MKHATTVAGLAIALATVGCGNDAIDATEVEAGIEESLSTATLSGHALEKDLAASGL